MIILNLSLYATSLLNEIQLVTSKQECICKITNFVNSYSMLLRKGNNFHLYTCGIIYQLYLVLIKKIGAGVAMG